MDDASIDEEPPALPFLVAGIGASAGGLEALQELFEHIPAETGVAFVVVQHLSPDFDSMMVELLARRAAIRVVEAEDGTQPVPNHLYVLPPKKDITLEGGMLRLRDRPAGLAPHRRSTGSSPPWPGTRASTGSPWCCPAPAATAAAA
jgi:two-component system CheB/CheR fusion protein